MDWVCNDKVRERLGKEALLNMVWRRQNKWLDHEFLQGCAGNCPADYQQVGDNKGWQDSFNLLEQNIKVNGLSQCLGQIFNCDKTEMPLSHKPPNLLAHVGQKHLYTVSSGEKLQITILDCASASVYSIPPILTYHCKSLQRNMTMGKVPGTFYGLSESAQMESSLRSGSSTMSWYTFHPSDHYSSFLAPCPWAIFKMAQKREYHRFLL